MVRGNISSNLEIKQVIVGGNIHGERYKDETKQSVAIPFCHTLVTNYYPTEIS